MDDNRRDKSWAALSLPSPKRLKRVWNVSTLRGCSTLRTEASSTRAPCGWSLVGYERDGRDNGPRSRRSIAACLAILVRWPAHRGGERLTLVSSSLAWRLY